MLQQRKSIDHIASRNEGVIFTGILVEAGNTGFEKGLCVTMHFVLQTVSIVTNTGSKRSLHRILLQGLWLPILMQEALLLEIRDFSALLWKEPWHCGHSAGTHNQRSFSSLEHRPPGEESLGSRKQLRHMIEYYVRWYKKRETVLFATSLYSYILHIYSNRILFYGVFSCRFASTLIDLYNLNTYIRSMIKYFVYIPTIRKGHWVSSVRRYWYRVEKRRFNGRKKRQEWEIMM